MSGSLRWVVGVLGVVVAASCSHTTPYPGVAPTPAPVPEAAEIAQRVILLGDAGEPAEHGEPVLASMYDTLAAVPGRSVVVYLGDNVYPAGIPEATDDDHARADSIMRVLVDATRGVQTFFVPGNHDWEDGNPEGLPALRRQGAWLDATSTAILTPTPGCAGPEVHDLAVVRLIAIDSHWWLHDGPKGELGCTATEYEEVLAGLREALAGAGTRPTIVVGHHPLLSRGPHGGFFTAAEYIFPSLMAPDWRKWILVPVPFLGPLIRKMGATQQDFSDGENEFFRESVMDALRTAPPLAYAAGHEHSLQVFDGGDAATTIITSGAGSSARTTPVGHDAQTRFAHSHTGFVMLDIMTDGRVLLRVVEPNATPVPYWEWLDPPGS